MIRTKELINETHTAICQSCGGEGKVSFSCCGDDIKGTEYEDYGICPTCKEHLGDCEEDCEECNGTGIIQIDQQ